MIDVLLLFGGLGLVASGLLYALISCVTKDRSGERVGWILFLIGFVCVGIESYAVMELSHQSWVREEP